MNNLILLGNLHIKNCICSSQEADNKCIGLNEQKESLFIKE